MQDDIGLVQQAFDACSDPGFLIARRDNCRDMRWNTGIWRRGWGIFPQVGQGKDGRGQGTADAGEAEG